MIDDRQRLAGSRLTTVMIVAMTSVSCGPPRERPDEQAALAQAEVARFATAPKGMPSLVVTSPAFEAGGEYPAEFTCDGGGSSPPVEWSGAPAGTRSYALEVWHVPGPGSVKSYWVLYDIPAEITRVSKNAANIGTQGINDKGRNDYDPMCSKGPGKKTYHITVHALSSELKATGGGLTRAELLLAIEHTELSRGTLSFSYTRGQSR